MLRRRPWETLGVVALMVLTSTVEGAGIGFLVPVLEAINNGGDAVPSSPVSRYISTAFGWANIPFELWTIMLAGFVLIATQALLKYFQGSRSVKLSASVSADVRIEVHRSLLHSDLAFLQSKKGGDLASLVVSETGRYRGALTGVLNLMAIVIASVTYLVLAVILSWSLLLVALGMFAITSFALKYELGRARIYGDRLSQLNGALLSTTVEQIGGVRILKAFNLETQSSERFTNVARDMAQLYFLVAKSSSRMASLFEATIVGGLFVIIYFAVTFSSLSVPMLLTFIFVLYRLYPRVGGVNKAFHSLMFGIPAVQNLTRLMEETGRSTISSGSKHHSRLEDGIRFEAVSFAYEDGTPVLNQVDFAIPRGKTIAVVGSSGAGKTTLVNLLMRFYDPTEGRILVDGKDLKDLDLTSWRSTLSLVNQDIFLFNDTIRNNIAMGKLGATEEEVVQAAKNAYADEFIKDLPDSYETVIGDRGTRLSGGQRQRIALARAIVRDPQVLILDEATSELDSRSEQLIRRAVDDLAASRTIFIIAHRLSTIRHADNILVLEDGRIAEEGSHEKLIETNGHYAEFLQIQDRVANRVG